MERLVLQDGILSKFLKLIVDIGTALLKFANSDIGQTIIKVTLLVGAIRLLQTAIDKVGNSTKIMMFLQGVQYETELVTTDMNLATVATNLFNAALTAIEKHPIILALALLTTAVLAVKNAWEDAKTAVSDANAEFESASSEYDQATENIKNLEEELETLQDKMANPNLSSGELEALKEQEESLNRQIILEQKLADEAKNRAKEEAKTARKTIGAGVGYSNYWGGKTTDISGTTEEQVERQIEDTKRLNGLIEENRQAMLNLAKTKEEYNRLSESEKNAYDTYNKKLEHYSSILKDVDGSLASNIEMMEGWKAIGIDDDGTLQALIDDYYNLQEATSSQSFASADEMFEKLGHSQKEVEEGFGDDEESLKSFQEALASGDYETAYSYALQAISDSGEELEQTLDETVEAYRDAVSAVTSMEGAFTSLNDAINEYNSTGTISLDMLDKLLALEPEYLSLLDWENGKMSLNEESALALANAKIDIAEATLLETTKEQIASIAHEQYSDTLQQAGKAGVVAKKGAELASQGAELSGKQALEASKDWDKFWQSAMGENGKLIKTKDQARQIKELEKATKNAFASLENMRGGLTSTSRGLSSYSSSAKKASSATNDLNKALEEQIKQYEKVIKYIKSKFDEEIDRIKELKTTEIDSIKERIDALGDLRDAELDAIQVKIDALNEENDALGEQLELQQLLDNLAKAKSSKVKIYRDGRFVYDQDQEQVSEAQKALNEYYAKKRLQDQIKALEDYKDSVKKNYDKQIDDLKAFQKEREKYYDAQIKYWQDYKKNFENMVNSYENEQNRLQALQLTGIDFEAQGWQSRLGNLQSFVNSYIDLLRQQVNATRSAQAEIEAIQSQGSGGGSGWNGGSATVSSGTYYNLQTRGIKGSTSTAKINGKTVLKPAYQNGGAKMISVAKKVKKHASGSNYIKADELAVVGEDPHKEIVIGSNLNTNSGVMMNLQKGSGVVPATATSSLMSLADKIRANGVNATANDLTSSGEVVNMDIANVNVKADNADEFVQSMREFKLSMLQRTYK